MVSMLLIMAKDFSAVDLTGGCILKVMVFGWLGMAIMEWQPILFRE